jgi:hypothetical protein
MIIIPVQKKLKLTVIVIACGMLWSMLPHLIIHIHTNLDQIKKIIPG